MRRALLCLAATAVVLLGGCGGSTQAAEGSVDTTLPNETVPLAGEVHNMDLATDALADASPTDNMALIDTGLAGAKGDGTVGAPSPEMPYSTDEVTAEDGTTDARPDAEERAADNLFQGR